MRSGWRHVLRILVAKASEPERGGHALFKAYETTICASADSPAAVNRAPRIVLGFGACSNADDTDANSQHEQQQPHSRLLGWPLSHKCLLLVFYSMLTKDEARRIAATASFPFCYARSRVTAAEDARSEKKTGAIQVEQAHTVGWRAGPNGLKRVRAGAGAECFSLAEETPHAVTRARTAEKTR